MTSAPRPSADEVHLYALTLPGEPAELNRLQSFLSPAETARAALLKSEPVKQRYLAGRGLLREILAGYLGLEPKKVQLATGVHGKPYLPGSGADLRFNLAHSGDRLLLALAAGREVGVDIEMIDPDKPLQAMAKLVFSGAEQDYLSGLASPRLETAFYRQWVRKEACLKACGRGFSLPAGDLELPLFAATAAATLVRCDRRDWYLLDLELPEPYCAALVVETFSLYQCQPAVVPLNHRRLFNR
jgi:4'-phosphopantetheinyl transferase